jgi:hypothetical protein
MKKNAGVSTKKIEVKTVKKEPEAYLTKRILVSAARRGFKEAAKEAMQVMGYVVIAHEGWVVKKYADGRIERISQIEQINSKNAFALD